MTNVRFAFASCVFLLACAARSELDAPTSTSTTASPQGAACVETCVDEDIATGDAGGNAIAVDCDVVFWGTDNGKLFRHDAEGNHELSSDLYVVALTLDATTLYAATMDRKLVTIPRAGGDVHEIGSAGDGPLRIRDGRIYFMDSAMKGISSTALDGSAVEVLAGGFGSVTDWDIDDQNLYVAADHAVYEVTLGSANAPAQLTTTEGDGSVAVFGSHLFVADSVARTLVSIPLAGGSATTCWGRFDSAGGVVSDSSGVYWSAGAFNAGSMGWLLHAPLDPCTTGEAFDWPYAGEHVSTIATSPTAVYATLHNIDVPKSASSVTVRKQCKR
jgi:hypothetical protein